MFKLNGNSTYAPVTLDDGNVTLTNGTDLVMMGWGATSCGGYIWEHSEQLIEVEVDYIPNQVCQIKYQAGLSLGSITERMLCAGNEGKAAYAGDSGGPIIDKATGIQVGVYSWGFGCADADHPDIYARVSDQYEWI
uniref:Peptidase S1 domain-containing protein n=1 Tax=Leptocylindrus danicus TaxID=163516 RepID=A0A7S2KFC6_9STRA|mmetsp:Transcript_22270/g.33431  ORF Transcript_22270/g.33431 Transcript_22270/m.33431 type:complete len:136 (+) Transcript_22270:428-835(+)